MPHITEQLCRYAKLLVEKGLVAGPGGNISARDGDTVYLSPSGYGLDEIKRSEWVRINLKTGKRTGALRPTCETSMHLGCYVTRPDIRAVVHTHPPLTIGIVSAGFPFKPSSPDFVAILGRELGVVNYVVPAGEEIRNAVCAQLAKGYNVLLLENHGAVCVGASLKEACMRSWLLEESAKTVLAGAIVGKMRTLTPEEVRQVEMLEAEDYRKALLKKGK